MEIVFRTKKFQKECNDFKLLVRRYGEREAKLIRNRLTELAAAENLSSFIILLGPRCHKLKGDKKDMLSADLVHPYRLLFVIFTQSKAVTRDSGGSILEPDRSGKVLKSPEIRLEDLTSSDFSRIRPWIDPRIFRIFQAPVDDDQLAALLTATDEGRPKSLGYRIVRVFDAEVVGMIHATIDWSNNLVHIGQIVVDPTLRGTGIGAAGTACRSWRKSGRALNGLDNKQMHATAPVPPESNPC